MATVLVIEDETSIRKNLVRFLKLDGYAVIEAEDGQAGFEAVQAHRPDLILCDVMMPRMTGFEVLAAIQQTPALMGIPFIFLSASAEQERLKAGLEMGAKGYVTKPFTLQDLRALLAEHLPANAP